MSRPHQIGFAVRVTVVGLLLLVHGALAIRAASSSSSVIDRYWVLTSERGTPSVDYAVEYPILTLGVLHAERALSEDRTSLRWIVVATNLALDAALAALVLTEWGFGASVVYMLGVALLGKLVFDKTDLLPTFLATLAVIWSQRGRAARSGGALALGAGLKLWPLALTALLWPRASQRQSRRFAMGLLTVSGASAAVWLSLSGWPGPDQVLTFRHARGWQVESLPANIVRFFDAGNATAQAGAWRLGSASLSQQILLWCVAATVIAWASWRGREQGKVTQGWVAVVACLLVFSGLLSPQFILWLLPAAAMAWAFGERALATLVLAVALMTRIEFGGLFGFGGVDGVLTGDTGSVMLLTLRNAMLVGLLIYALTRLRFSKTIVSETAA